MSVHSLSSAAVPTLACTRTLGKRPSRPDRNVPGLIKAEARCGAGTASRDQTWHSTHPEAGYGSGRLPSQL